MILCHYYTYFSKKSENISIVLHKTKRAFKHLVLFIIIILYIFIVILETTLKM
jgi:hypothetical protein